MPLPTDYNPTRLTVTPDWQEQEAQANAAAMGLPMQPSFLDNLKTAGSNIISGIANIPNDISTIVNSKEAIIDKILGKDQERYQFWPEKLIRDALSAPHDVLTSKTPLTSQDLIKPAMDISALAGTGGLGGTGEAAGTSLGAGPFLRPALKYEGKIYKAPMGGQHMDAIPQDLQPEFTRQAMSGEDISNFNFGFMNHKGQFLDRQKALDYAVENGLLDPHDARYGALTSTMDLRSDNPTGAAIGALEKSGPFFSAAEKAVDAIPQAKMTGGQWLGTIANKPGVKPEELDWTGLKNYLEANKDKAVTKADIQEHLNNNKVEVNEVNKGGDVQVNPKTFYENATQGQRLPDWSQLNQRERQHWVDEADKNTTGNTKYHNYQLPGGENYREKLLTLPTKEDANHARMTEIEKLLQSRPAGRERDALRAEYRDLAGKTQQDQTYKSSHWDEPNILAHMRMNDRTIEGKKSLHLEEIQSDWHQQGRERGYKDPEAQKKYDAAYKAVEDARTELRNKNADMEEITKVLNPLLEAKTKAAEANTNTIPNAPFKKSWHELALKRAIYEAATNGYDRLSWTPGEAQAARYDLSKSVDKIAIPMVNKDGTRSVRIDAKEGTPFKLMIDKNGIVNGLHSAGQFSGKPLSDVVGKEMAEKIMKLEKPTEFSGEGLKIGGEGMKGFYDKMIPNAVEKLLKEHGVKVQKSQSVHYIEIPQSLKNQAKKGFPLFSTGLPIPNEDKK